MDTRWLEKRGAGWYAVQAIPRPLQKLMGRKRFLKSLKTRDHKVATARRYAALADFARQIAAAQRDTTEDPLVTRGLAWRSSMDHPEAAHALALEVADTRREHGHAAGTVLLDLAFGRATPVEAWAEQWLAEGGPKGPLKDKTKRSYRSDLGQFTTWLRGVNISPTIEAVTKRLAGRYMNEALLATVGDRRTANRKLAAMSSYWRWLVKRGHVEVNPWTGQSVAKGVAQGGGKRPFTDAEVATLMDGPADPELADAMRVAALSGMRIEEIYRLTAEDCRDGWFTIKDAKTRAGNRRVPIHGELGEIIRSRSEQDAGYLFTGRNGNGRVGERSMAASKRFGKYRKRIGIDDRADGQRQSNIDFHSFRRWFVTKARAAGIDRATVAAVVGHEVGNITDDVYSGGPSDAQRIACVEAVQLP